ncbi:MAG: hypothetical protein M5U12_06715 [Verrucomicrobia bacterium]|nr:hypothetical protein [Verrucomicrobiota bacterium]
MSGLPDGVRVDTSTFEAAMNQFIALKKLTLAEGLRLQAGLLADELVRDTPPQAGTVAGKSFGARKAGEARVSRDIRRAVRPLDPRQWASDGMADLIRSRNVEALQTAFSRFSPLRILPFSPGLHQEARSAEGAVEKDKGRATPDMAEHVAYVKRMKARVGLAKGGWAASQKALGRRVQNWLTAHLRYGRLIDHTDRPEPSITMENDARWAGSRLADITVRKADDPTRGRMRRWIEGALAAQARKAGLA